jgi:hypothetical protein
MGVLMPLRRGLVLLPAVLALASVAPRARMPYGNVGDGRLDVKGSSQPSSKFSLRIWLVKRTLSGHRNSVKLQTLPFSHGEPHPAAVRPWRLVKLIPTRQGRVNSPPA